MRKRLLTLDAHVATALVLDETWSAIRWKATSPQVWGQTALLRHSLYSSKLESAAATGLPGPVAFELQHLRGVAARPGAVGNAHQRHARGLGVNTALPRSRFVSALVASSG